MVVNLIWSVAIDAHYCIHQLLQVLQLYKKWWSFTWTGCLCMWWHLISNINWWCYTILFFFKSALIFGCPLTYIVWLCSVTTWVRVLAMLFNKFSHILIKTSIISCTWTVHAHNVCAVLYKLSTHPLHSMHPRRSGIIAIVYETSRLWSCQQTWLSCTCWDFRDSNALCTLYLVDSCRRELPVLVQSRLLKVLSLAHLYCLC